MSSQQRSSQQRIDSSRANGGLTSGLVVLASESMEEFDALRDEYFADYQPQTRAQFNLVDQLVATRWRLNRVISLQSALEDIQIERRQPRLDKEFQGCGGYTGAAIPCRHLCDDSGALASLRRHKARLSAELRQTVKLLADRTKKIKKCMMNPTTQNPRPLMKIGSAPGPAEATTREAPPGRPGSCLLAPASALESLRRHKARLSAEFRRTFKLLNARLENQKIA